ncbi:MAG: glycosyltransferase family 4 protein [Chthonomonadales bacterium]
MLILTDKFAPHAGGTARVWTEYCRCWPPDQVHVIAPYIPGCRRFDAAQPYRITRIPYPNVPKIRMPILHWRMLRALMAACRAQQPQVLHLAQLLENGVHGPAIRRRFAIPYVLHAYGEEVNAILKRPPALARVRSAMEEAAAVITISRYTLGLLQTRIGCRAPSAIARPAVRTDFFVPGDGSAMRKKLGIEGGPVLLTVARLMRRKGHDRVLEAMPAILRRFPETRYVIAGTGGEERRLRKIAIEKGVDHSVIFLGRVPEEQIVGLYQSADVFVHPNRELPNGDVEGFGIVFLEANACGVPVIGGNSGGTPDAIRHGVTGYLVDPNDVNEIADRILTLLGDAALRARMGEAGREWAKQFTWEAAAKTVWDLSCKVVCTE